MIVNVNPYDTGFDENSHVMRFSAVAREVQTTASNKVSVSFPGFGLKRQISSQLSAFKMAVSGGSSGGMQRGKVRVSVPVLASASAGAGAGAPGSTLGSCFGSGAGLGARSAGGVGSTLGAGPSGHHESGVGGGRESESFVMVEEELEVVEEPDSDTEEEDDETDVLVDSLFEQLREMKTRVSTGCASLLVSADVMKDGSDRYSCMKQRCAMPRWKRRFGMR